MNQQQVFFLPAVEPGGDNMIKADLWHEIHSRFKLKEEILSNVVYGEE